MSAKILITFYSTYGHTFQLAQSVREGAEQAGAEVRLRRVAELPQAAEAMKNDENYQAAQKSMAHLEEVTHDDLRWADGIAWGTPTRYGNMAAQVKQFIDTTSPLWSKGELEDKASGVFVSTATQHGGQEATILSFHIPLLHLGMILVGSPYGQNPTLFNVSEIHGGSPYGPSTIAGGDGSLQPKEGDLIMSKRLGERLTKVATQLKSLRK
ncbi:NAD(P)H dehydrogenase (quinone) [Neolewinella xylanilytica]|uniref:NAD(P)H dehydrogenase (Quinone) n=1 Tax=Neolewinella xylanilytica TaxID=1514080 RepID=A0A2S6IBL3_9BACT|nr:NAD(P)H:quinone oxidoreductase [Neolewinella xylanilytica]PPK88888.1 NAD(P)H dehydrogenase (quinone) [Neolewinella xylanilytica]